MNYRLCRVLFLMLQNDYNKRTIKNSCSLSFLSYKYYYTFLKLQNCQPVPQFLKSCEIFLNILLTNNNIMMLILQFGGYL